MTYIFLGPDNEQKNLKIAEIKKRFLTSKDSDKFDYDNLYANKLDAKSLKRSLLKLPALSKKRVLLLHDFHKLSAYNKKLIIEFLSSSNDHVELILTSDHVSEKDSFVKKIKEFAKVVGSAKKEGLNVFDMTRAMTRRKYAEALKILSALMSQGQHPLQLIPGIVWFWGKARNQLTEEKYEEGLLCLQDADLDIKRSRLKPSSAMERLVVRLCAIMK